MPRIPARATSLKLALGSLGIVFRDIGTSPLLILFLTFDLAYFGANLLKFFEGGWFPLVMGLGMQIDL